MARAEVTGRKPRVKSPAPTKTPPTAVFSIASFCEAHGISQGFYFSLRDQGRGPREMRLGSRVFITHESAARWRIEREAATTGTIKVTSKVATAAAE